MTVGTFRARPRGVRGGYSHRELTDSVGFGALDADAWSLRRVTTTQALRWMAFLTTCMMVGGLWIAIDDRGIFFLSGAASLWVLSLPLLRGDYDLLSPWSLILLAGFVGYGVRGLFISLGITGSRSIDDLYLLGHSPSYFFMPSLAFLAAVSVLTFGYLIGGMGARSGRTRVSVRAWSPRAVPLVVAISAMVGLASFIMYGLATDGLSVASISAKRTVVEGFDTSDYSSYGQFRVLNNFAAVAFFVQLTHYAKLRVPHGLKTLRGWWLMALFANAAILPVYSSTRINVVFIVLGAITIEMALRRGRIPIGMVTGVLVGLIAFTSLLTALRAASQGSNGVVDLSTQTVVDTFVATRSFSDIPTSANIIRAVPQPLAYANGDTIVGWLAAPVPRSVWPGKPIISPGPTIGRMVYGNVQSGVPPGMVAESYWNFGRAGLLAIPLLSGLMLRWLERHVSGPARSDPARTVLLAAVIIHTGFDLMSNSVGYALYQLALYVVLLAPILAVLRPRARTQTHS